MGRRTEVGPEVDPALFQQNLMEWYRVHARKLPWRGAVDPYCIWLSEIMLQQTRVASVIEHYHEFLLKFPTLLALALAPEQDVLAAWSGLGYYRRARMLHKAAQFITEELGGVLPTNSVALRTLPGIGEYTSAAIASIAFGESVAVVDGNVERVLLRLTGRSEDRTAAGRAFLRSTAQELVPGAIDAGSATKPGVGRKTKQIAVGRPKRNPPGDHNQAMMELGATICLPRAPLCLHCPVRSLCMTKGEHSTFPRAKLRSREVAFLLSVRKRGVATEVLLAQRPAEASLMAGMYELPPLPLDAEADEMASREPLLRIRHAITNTNYYARIYAPMGPSDKALRRAVPIAKADLHWIRTATLLQLPLTGLCRKVLQRLDVMPVRPLRAPIAEEKHVAGFHSQSSKGSPVIDEDEDHDSF
ncbi:A/G-specific adenine glycosylase [Granulicella aggregans]|uniref:Adenine DNA glycosylase n=1 Tax=Granulicella aggregans TaxID=474949 RepID=A0A7W7ZEZ9_9BACT|nr:A/G-specific adenine glycosylase [Granulicella aggregans]MBB5058582.1 A/G-specific adenine glycosylase [Granulicella aggregans]